MTQSTADLHPSIVALVALSAHLASGHPNRGLCQLEKLKSYGISDAQIDMVIEIARHIRDEAAQKLDASFDAERKAAVKTPAKTKPDVLNNIKQEPCCTPTKGGTPCC